MKLTAQQIHLSLITFISKTGNINRGKWLSFICGNKLKHRVVHQGTQELEHFRADTDHNNEKI